MELADRTQQMLAKALYLDKFTLPVYNEMTAYEASIRTQEHIRTVMPIFEPIEEEYNAPLCQETFDVLWNMGWMGSIHEIPESLQRSPDYQFKFISPLSQSEDRADVGRFQAVSEIINTAAAIDPAFVNNIDLNKSGRAAIQGAGAPEEWLNSEEEVEAIQQQQAEQAKLQQEMAMMQEAGETASSLQGVANG